MQDRARGVVIVGTRKMKDRLTEHAAIQASESAQAGWAPLGHGNAGRVSLVAPMQYTTLAPIQNFVGHYLRQTEMDTRAG
jgi:hypothetical protein